MQASLAVPHPTSFRNATRTERAVVERALFIRYRDHGDVRAREELCARFMPLARQLARRYDRDSESFDDLVQVASLGLVKAIDRFDIDRGLAFSSYAVPTILGELRRYFRDTSWSVHVPRGMQERILAVGTATERLSRDLRRSPTPKEIGDDLGISAETVLETIGAAQAHDTASLDASLDDDDRPAFAAMGAPDAGYERIEYLSAIGPTLRALPERDRLVLKLRFVDDLKQSEIAQEVGVSQMHVSRLIRRALTRLQTVANAT